MMRFPCAVGVVLVLVVTAPAFGQTPTLDLPGLLAEVRAENPSLRAARLEAEALALRRDQETALPDPTAGLTAFPLPLVTARGYQRTQWRVEQAIPFPGKRSLRGDIADLSAEVAEAEAEVFAQRIVFEVKQAYYDLYRFQQQLGLVDDFQAQLRAFEEVAAARYEVGTGTQQSVLKAQIETGRLGLRKQQLDNDHHRALATLARLVNRPDLLAFGGAVGVEPPRMPFDEAALLPTALARRPEVQALERAGARAQKQIALAERDFLPDFSVHLSYFDIGDTDLPASADGRDAIAVGAGVNVPLWRGRLHAQREEAEVRARQVAARLEAFETNVRTHLLHLVHHLHQQHAQRELLQQTLIPQAETAQEATLNAYSTGRADFLALLDAERMLFDLRLDEADITARLLTTTAALEQALGVESLNEIE